MRWLAIALLIACQAKKTEQVPVPVEQPVPHVVDASVPDAEPEPPDDAAVPQVTEIHAMKLKGPFKFIDDACEALTPCGFTKLDGRGNSIDPPKTPTCNLDHDPNSTEDLSHDREGTATIRIMSQACGIPEGLRFVDNEYYVFVKRGDAWWVSEPVFDWSYHEKWGSGSMTARFNDQGGNTIIGIQASDSLMTCDQFAGEEVVTDEWMVRVDVSGSVPVVYPGLLVGERFERKKSWLWDKADTMPKDCKLEKQAVSMDEHWHGIDDLVLTGPWTWQTRSRGADNVPIIGGRGPIGPSNVGHYRFVAPL
ncbi:MAG: hypothetical protein QM831_06070 [Kofleriaceae bacterium]